jgi:hypothetical protein
MSKNVQQILNKMSKHCQKVVKKFQKSFQQVVKKSCQKSSQKINKDCFDQRPHLISGRRTRIGRIIKIAFTRPGADYVAPGKQIIPHFSNSSNLLVS